MGYISEYFLKEKFIGALIGTFVGDALGMPLEGLSIKEIKERFGEVRDMLPARLGLGTYTDDTEMMIATAESLIENRGFNGVHMAKCFLENFHPERGYGAGTKKALSFLRSGESWDKAGGKVISGGSFGNGAAMRIAPVGILYYKDKERIKEVAHKVSMITHSHPLGKEGAAILAYAVALGVNCEPYAKLDKEAFLEELKDYAESEEYKSRLETIKVIIKHELSREKVVSILGNSSIAFESVPLSIYSFLKYSQSFEEAVIYAVNLGGDTDSIAAMTGAISGACHGIRKIPERWLAKLENGLKGKDYIYQLGEKLWEIGKR